MAREKIGVFEARARLWELLEQVRRGRTYVITRRGRPVAELRPFLDERAKLTFGADAGRIVIRDDFDAPFWT